jgi:hypothetical protein
MDELEEEPKKEKRGGYRPGAGRKVGSKNILTVRRAILEYTTPNELHFMVERAKKVAKTDNKMLQWYLEMCFGKPKVVERQGDKTTNNIALFLDNLEQKRLNPIEGNIPFVGDLINNGTDTRYSTTGQIMEAETSLHDNRQETE